MATKKQTSSGEAKQEAAPGIDPKATLHQHLARMQKTLEAPKSKWNKFSEFYYRSAEDILEGAKKIAGPCTVTLSESLLMVGDRYYIVAKASLNLEGESISVESYAREQETKKGMDQAQISGSATSYARKYALGGLFGLSDGDDPDSGDNSREHAKKLSKPRGSGAKKKTSSKKKEEAPVEDPDLTAIKAIVGGNRDVDWTGLREAAGIKKDDTKAILKLFQDYLEDPASFTSPEEGKEEPGADG